MKNTEIFKTIDLLDKQPDVDGKYRARLLNTEKGQPGEILVDHYKNTMVQKAYHYIKECDHAGCRLAILGNKWVLLDRNGKEISDYADYISPPSSSWNYIIVVSVENQIVRIIDCSGKAISFNKDLLWRSCPDYSYYSYNWFERFKKRFSYFLRGLF